MTEKYDFDFTAAEAGPKEQIVEVGRGDFFVRSLNIALPNFTGAPTATITIYDNFGKVVYTKAAIANNATTYDDTKIIPLCGGGKIQIVLSVVAGSVGTVSVVLYNL